MAGRIDSNPTSGGVAPEELAFQASYRRGRMLVLIIVAVTVVVLFQNEICALWSDGLGGITRGRLFSWLILGWICWAAYRGGRFARVCFSFIYGLGFVAFLMASTLIVSGHFAPWTGNSVPDVDQSWHSILLLTASGGWTAFSLWVLWISKDACLYMKTNRRGLAEEEALAFEWKRVQPMRERPAHAP